MLKGKRGVSACSLSSCRIRAEALARAFNSRIWPCTWAERESTADGDGMANGEDEEMFFDASPSPVEYEEEAPGRHTNSSAATEAGRTRLYQLLQQHATDDNADVFYDVSEEVCATEGMLENCVCECQSSFEWGNGARGGLFQNAGVPFQTLDDSQCERNLNPAENECPHDLRSSTENHEEPEEGKAEDSVKETSSPCSPEKEEKTAESDTQALPCTEQHDGVESSVSPSDKCTESEKAPEDSVQEESVSDPQSCECEQQNAISIEITEDSEAASSPSDAPPPPPPNSSDSSPVSSRLQVFDEDRPRISRSTSLKTGKTPPGTPSRKKIVRFADVLGLDLEDVHHIMTSDLPNIPSSAYTDLVLADEDLPSSALPAETVEVQSRVPETWECVQVSMGSNLMYPMFTIPGQLPDFIERVRTQGICLETVVVSDMSVQCTCRVMNWGFKKKVVVRYTVNNWASSNDIDASYVPSSTQGETDTFAFNIFLSPLHRQVQFALRYIVNGREYWDNNLVQNYRLGYHGDEHLASDSGPMWQHQFW